MLCNSYFSKVKKLGLFCGRQTKWIFINIIYLVFNASWLYHTWFKRLAGYGSNGQGKILFLSTILKWFWEGCY